MLLRWRCRAQGTGPGKSGPGGCTGREPGRRPRRFFPFRRGRWRGMLLVAHALVPGGEIFQLFWGPWIEFFRGRENGEERVVVPTRGLRSRDKSGTYNAVILARRGQAGEGLPLVYSIHGAPNGGC